MVPFLRGDRRCAITPVRLAAGVALLALASSAYQVLGPQSSPAMLAVGQVAAVVVFQT